MSTLTIPNKYIVRKANALHIMHLFIQQLSLHSCNSTLLFPAIIMVVEEQYNNMWLLPTMSNVKYFSVFYTRRAQTEPYCCHSCSSVRRLSHRFSDKRLELHSSNLHSTYKHLVDPKLYKLSKIFLNVRKKTIEWEYRCLELVNVE